MREKLKYLVGLKILLSLTVILYLIPTPVAGAENPIVIYSSQNFVTLNPLATNDVYSGYVIDAIFDELLYLDPETQQPKPYLAESWEFSKDRCEIIFHIKRGVKAHNGEKINAEDVAFTFNWVINPINFSPNASQFGWLEKVQVLDEYSAKFVVKPQSCPFPLALQSQTFPVVPKDTFQSMGEEDFGQNPVGSGPFRFVEWEREDHVTLIKNETYWLKEPRLEKVIFRPVSEPARVVSDLKKGKVDIVDSLPAEAIPELRTREDIDVRQEPSLSYFYLGFNISRPPYSDIRFRKAVYYSTDFDAAVHNIFNGLTAIRAYGAVPPAIWANDRRYLANRIALPENDELARNLFEILREEGVMLADFSPKIYCPPDVHREKLGREVASNLRDHGIDAQVKVLKWDPLLQLLRRSIIDPSGRYGMYILGWSGNLDPSSFLYYLFGSQNARIETGNNLSFYKNTHVDDLLNRAAKTSDRKIREEAYVQAQRIIMEDYVHIPAYHYVETRGVRSRVRGYRIDPISPMSLVDPETNVWLGSSATFYS